MLEILPEDIRPIDIGARARLWKDKNPKPKPTAKLLTEDNMKRSVDRRSLGELHKFVSRRSYRDIPLNDKVARPSPEAIMIFMDRYEYLREYGYILTLKNITSVVCDYYSISLEAMFSNSRLVVVARPRQVAMYLAGELIKRLSSPQVGKFYNREHTTILSGKRKIRRLVKNDNETRKDIEVLKSIMLGENFCYWGA